MHVREELALVPARCGEAAVRSFQFPEQANILDGDHRLVGEGLQERDLIVSESARLTSGQRDRPDSLAVTQHRHHDLAPVATLARIGAYEIGEPLIRLDVRKVECRSLANGPAVDWGVE